MNSSIVVLSGGESALAYGVYTWDLSRILEAEIPFNVDSKEQISNLLTLLSNRNNVVTGYSLKETQHRILKEILRGDESFDFYGVDLDALSCIYVLGQNYKIGAETAIKSVDRTYTIGSLDSMSATDRLHLYLSSIKKLSETLNDSIENILRGERGQLCLTSARDSYRTQEEILSRDQERMEAIESLKDGKINRYVFFDTECSNCIDREGKICEFGYCITDTEFNIVEKKEYIINPGKGYYNDFHLKDRNGDIELHLTYEADNYRLYRMQPELDRFIPAIDRVLTLEGSAIFGFAVDNDLRYVDYGYSRYEGRTGYGPLNLVAFDVQALYSRFDNSKDRISLDNAVAEYGKRDESIRYHRAMDDAIATMEALRNLSDHTGMSVPEMVAQTGPKAVALTYDCIDPVHLHELTEEQKEVCSQVRARINEQYRIQHQKLVELHPFLGTLDDMRTPDYKRQLKSSQSFGKRIYITDEVICSDSFNPETVTESIDERGLVLSPYRNISDVLIVLGDSQRDQLKEEGEERRIQTLEEFLNDR